LLHFFFAAMGNTCAQDCDVLNDRRSNEATFDMNAERTCVEYQKVSVLQSQASRPSDLPRLGLGAQSQESLPKGRLPSYAMQEPETTKTNSVIEGPILSPIELPLDSVAYKESFHMTSMPEDNECKEKIQPARMSEDIGACNLASANVVLENEEPVQDSPILPQVLEPVIRVPVAAVAASTISQSLELVFDVNGVEKIIHVGCRPLGAEFTKRVRGRTKIEKIRPRSHASELGMEVGWTIKSIGGEDTTKKSFAEVQTALKNGMMALPVQD
jgi:hypothetical protein